MSFGLRRSMGPRVRTLVWRGGVEGTYLSNCFHGVLFLRDLHAMRLPNSSLHVSSSEQTAGADQLGRCLQQLVDEDAHAEPRATLRRVDPPPGGTWR